jgi:hypothetical protein
MGRQIVIMTPRIGNSAAAPQDPDDANDLENVSAFNFIRPGGYRVRVS